MVGVVLAGGKGSRLPFQKGLIELAGKRLVESNVGLLKKILGPVVVSANEPELFFYLGVPVVGDVLKPSGPMTGILSALMATGAEEVFVTACDMPFLNEELIRYIIHRRAAGEAQGKTATVPVFEKRPEPLMAVYTKGAAGVMEAMIKEGRASMGGLLKELDVAYIEEAEVRGIDPEGLSFFNINTLEDYGRAMERIKGGRGCLV